MPKEIITVGSDGSVNSEFDGFKGRACLKQAAEISRELEKLGIVTEVNGLQMKDLTEVEPVAQEATVKVERG
ncbi:MAG: hypothetical protein AAB451_02625 [Patescibacteria group bacterium]